MAIEVMEQSFEKEVAQSAVPVLVYFYLPSCAKCAVMMSTAEGFEKNSDKKLKLNKLNIAKNQGLAKKLAILSAPTFLVYKDGEEIERFYGERLNMRDMENFLQETT